MISIKVFISFLPSTFTSFKNSIQELVIRIAPLYVTLGDLHYVIEHSNQGILLDLKYFHIGKQVHIMKVTHIYHGSIERVGKNNSNIMMEN